MRLRPSSFPRDPYVYAAGQAGHSYFFGVVGALIFSGHGALAPFIVGATYAIGVTLNNANIQIVGLPV